MKYSVAEIADDFKPLTIFAKKVSSELFDNLTYTSTHSFVSASEFMFKVNNGDASK